MPAPRDGYPKTLKKLYDWLDGLVTASYPAQAGQGGKFLTTNGTSTSWATPMNSQDIGGNTAVTLTGATPVACTFTTYRTTLTTSDVGDLFNLGNGAGRTVGERKLVVLGTRTGGTHTVILDHANMLKADGTAAAGCVLDAADEFVLVEWTGLKWRTVYAAAGVVS